MTKAACRIFFLGTILASCATQDSGVVSMSKGAVEEKLAKAGMNCCEMKLVSQANSEALRLEAAAFLKQVEGDIEVQSTACKHAHNSGHTFGTLIAIRTSKNKFDIYLKPMHLDGLVSAGVCESVF